MSQGHSVESSTRPSPAQPINPALQAALGSLDVQLEEELSRYRRERGGRGASPAPRMNHDRVRNKPIDLISVSATGGRNQSPAPAKPPSAPPPPPPPPASVPPQGANLEGKGVETTIQNETWDTPPAPAPSFDLSAPGAELASLATPPHEPAWHPEPAENPPEFVNPTSTHVPPNDYLESSEQLLRSLVEEEASSAPRRSERSFLDSLLTPLGVGSLLLLLFSTATLGYLVTNPGSLSYLGLARVGESPTPTVAQSPTTATTPTTNAPAAGSEPSGPNLATDEFVDVNLDTLSTLPSSSPAPRSTVAGLPKTQVGVPTIAPLPSSSTPGNSAAGLPPAGQSGSVPLPALPPAATVPVKPASPSPLPGLPQRSPVPSVQPSLKPSPTAATPTPNPQGFYYVFVKYDGESSLQQARKVVPDAYLSPEGTQIYLGAFKKESQAQTLVKELQTQGISAAVDQP